MAGNDKRWRAQAHTCLPTCQTGGRAHAMGYGVC
jgi:hypothetical protein